MGKEAASAYLLEPVSVDLEVMLTYLVETHPTDVPVTVVVQLMSLEGGVPLAEVSLSALGKGRIKLEAC
jgi:hypothetical protein